MQNYITTYINECEARYEILWNKLYELNVSSESDFANITALKSQVPENIKQEDLMELNRLLSQIEIKIKGYNNSLYDIKKEYDQFVIDTSKYLKDLNSSPEVKGNMILSRNSLEQKLNEYYGWLKQGYSQVQTILGNLYAVFELMSFTGNGEKQAIDLDTIRTMVNEIVAEKLSITKSDFVDDDIALKAEIGRLNVKISDILNRCTETENKLRYAQEDHNMLIKQISDKVNGLAEVGQMTKDEISKHALSIADDLSTLRNQVNTRIRGIENNLNNNMIRKY